MHQREPVVIMHAHVPGVGVVRGENNRRMEGVLVVPIAQCRGYCARISAGLGFEEVGLGFQLYGGVSGSDATSSLREGWDKSEE